MTPGIEEVIQDSVQSALRAEGRAQFDLIFGVQTVLLPHMLSTQCFSSGCLVCVLVLMSSESKRICSIRKQPMALQPSAEPSVKANV